MHATAPSARARYAPVETRADEAPVALHFEKGFRTGCSTTQFKQQKVLLSFPLMPTTFYVRPSWKPCLLYNSLTNSKSRERWIYNTFSTQVPLPGNEPQAEIRGLYIGDLWVFPLFLSRGSAQFHQPELGINQKILRCPRTAGNVSRFLPTTPRRKTASEETISEVRNCYQQNVCANEV